MFNNAYFLLIYTTFYMNLSILDAAPVTTCTGSPPVPSGPSPLPVRVSHCQYPFPPRLF